MSEISDSLVEWTVKHFDKGWDTAWMAKKYPPRTEATYERALHVGLERRRVQRVADFMTGERV
jgi:hypothetical protein